MISFKLSFAEISLIVGDNHFLIHLIHKGSHNVSLMPAQRFYSYGHFSYSYVT